MTLEKGPETPLNISPEASREDDVHTEERVLPNGEKKVFTIHTLRLDPDDVSVPELSEGAYSSFARADVSQAETPKPYQRRASSPTSPLDSGIDEVLSASAAPRGVAASSRMAASGRSVTGSRDTEPAYLRRGITINTNPPKEGRTHVWTLDAD